METKGVDVPHFIGDGYFSIVELDAVVCCWCIVPGPVTVQPIVEILRNIKNIQLT
jgi:hypothetical protein